MCSPFGISEIKSVNNKPRKREGKEGVLSAAFPSPCSNISSFTFPFPAPRFLLSAVPANRPSSFSLTFHLLRHQQEKPQPQPPCFSAAAWTASLARSTGEAGQPGTAHSAAHRESQAKLWRTGAPLLHVEFSDERFSWRCSTTFSGMGLCKQAHKSLSSRQVFLRMA